MAKKPSPKAASAGARITIDQLAGMMKDSFEHLEGRLERIDSRLDTFEKTTTERFNRVDERLEKIEFRLTGQDQRISILEDRVRQLATKVGFEFSN